MRRVIENRMLAEDYVIKNFPQSRSLRWIVETGADVRAEVAEIENKKRVAPSDAVLVDIAVVYHHWSLSKGEAKWNHAARAALDRVVDRDRGSYYYHTVDAMLSGRPLQSEQLLSLTQQAKTWPDDWWMAQLALHFGAGDTLNLPRIHGREVRAFLQFLIMFVIEAVIVIAGLLCAWHSWREFQKVLPANASQKAVRRLHRLWGPEVMLVWFSLAGIASIVIAALASYLISRIMQSFPGDSWTLWWVSVALGTLAAIATLVAWPMIIPWGMARSWRGLRHVFDLRLSEFKRARWWLVGMLMSGLSLGVYLLVDLLCRNLMLDVGATDSASRLFVEWGPAALPVGIVLGAVAAPFCEEVLFRGFLFNAFANRFGNYTGAVASSLIFSAGHFYGWFGSIFVFFYGIIFCFVYRKTGRLEASIIMHACVNLPLIILGWLSWSA